METGKVTALFAEVKENGTDAPMGAMSLLFGESAESLALALRKGLLNADMCNGEARDEDEGVGEDGMNGTGRALCG